MDCSSVSRDASYFSSNDDSSATLADTEKVHSQGLSNLTTWTLEESAIQLSDKRINQGTAHGKLTVEFPQKQSVSDQTEIKHHSSEDTCHDRFDNSEKGRSKSGGELESETLSREDFLHAGASSTLKLKPPGSQQTFLAGNEIREDLFRGILDFDTVASLLPKERTSTEESALEHILTLERDDLQQNRSPPSEDSVGFVTEEDSGIFDLSLAQQEDFENLEAREGLRDWTVRSHTPEQRRRHLSSTSQKSPKLKRQFSIPLYFNDSLSFFSESSDVFDKEGRWLLDSSSLITEEKQNTKKSLREDPCTGSSIQSLDPAASESILKEDLPCVSNQETSETEEPGSEDLSDSDPDDSPDIEDNPEKDMGKKSQSFSKGKQPHVVYSKDEFSEEYASPQRSKSLDKKKATKKDAEKKDRKKPKDRKRIPSDLSQGRNLKVSISAPIPMSQEVTKRRTKEATPGSPTQDAGTDPLELLADSEVVVVHQQSLHSAAAMSTDRNESNNNQSKTKLAHSRAGDVLVSPVQDASPVNHQHSSPEFISEIGNSKAFASHREPELASDCPPPKPKRVSLTNQLQKQNGKAMDGQMHLNGSPSVDMKNNHLYERKTEIAVERQVLLKQATKTSVKETDVVENPPKNHPTGSQQTTNPYTFVTRYVDGEEELILGALPLQNSDQKTSPETEKPVPKKSGKPAAAVRKFRHYACIEPVGKPVEIFTPENPQDGAMSKSPASPDPREDSTSQSLSKELCEPTQTTRLPGSPMNEIQAEQTPPVVVTGSFQDIPTTPVDDSSILPDDPPSLALPSSYETAEETSPLPTDTTLSVEEDRPRLNSSTDTTSTISIPPQSPPDLDYQDLVALSQTPSEHSRQTPSSEPSVIINFIEPDPTTEQKMVTVAMGMMPEPQKAEVTIINDDDQEINSTDEADVIQEQETALQQSQPSEEKEAAVQDPPLSPTVAASSRTDIPSISSKEEDDNEEDEDSGVYDASYRHSDWIYVGNNQELQMMTKQVDKQAGPSSTMETVAEVNSPQEAGKDTPFDRSDEGRESVTTTVSEKEFRTQYQSLAYRRVHRKTSAIDYQRLSLIARERNVTIRKENNMFGFRIQYSRPVVVTDVDKGGAAEQAGLRVGDMVLNVNGHDVRQAPHSHVVRLAMSGPELLDLVVGTNVCNTLNLYAEKPVMSGYLHKLGGAGMIRTWKKRWFVLKYDNCLYYYKTEDDVEPLGAIVLCNYTVMKARDVGKPFAFKLTKCKARTYYFHTPTEEEMSRWANHITEAAKPQNTSDIWLDISTHNVGLPALTIKNPDCHGFLNKMGAIRKNWKRRFCVLKDACLYYYKDMDAQHALGVAHFHGYSIQETEIGHKKFGLILKPPSEELRVFYFFADHETDRKRWVAAFALSIGRWIKTNNGDESDEESAEMLI